LGATFFITVSIVVVYFQIENFKCVP